MVAPEIVTEEETDELWSECLFDIDNLNWNEPAIDATGVEDSTQLATGCETERLELNGETTTLNNLGNFIQCQEDIGNIPTTPRTIRWHIERAIAFALVIGGALALLAFAARKIWLVFRRIRQRSNKRGVVENDLIDAEDPSTTSDTSAVEMTKQFEEAKNQILEHNTNDIIANHALGIYELAAIHLTAEEPKLDDIKLAIDALEGLLTATRGSLGEAEPHLLNALTQIRREYTIKRGLDTNGELEG